MTIYFYSTTDEYGAFSNFARYGVELDGAWWPTVEHFFQAQKFDDPTYRERIRTAATPKLAAEFGRSRTMPLRSDWEQVKDEVMYRAVLKKCQTHPHIRDVLLATGDEDIVENAPGDYYWGVAKTAAGKTSLGKS